MTLTQLIKRYGTSKGEDVMWASVDLISKTLETHLNAKEFEAIQKKIHYIMVGGHYDKEFAEKQIAVMYYKDSEGQKHFAPYWTEDDVRAIYNEIKSSIPEYNFYDFEVALNMIKSDYCPLLKRWFPNESSEDHLKRLVALTVNWLDDEDNPYGTEKVWLYFNEK
jgi:hypothetical protein